jgi:2-haloacid dehalogenase
MPRSLLPRLLSFDVFGRLINVREGSYGAFRSILIDVPGSSGVDVRAFFEY